MDDRKPTYPPRITGELQSHFWMKSDSKNLLLFKYRIQEIIQIFFLSVTDIVPRL